MPSVPELDPAPWFGVSANRCKPVAYIMLISSSRNGQAKQSWAGFCRFLVSLIVLLQNGWNLDGCCMLLLPLSKLSNIKGPFGKSCPLAPLVAVRTSPAMAAMGSN
jgi:hypothetical protein